MNGGKNTLPSPVPNKKNTQPSPKKQNKLYTTFQTVLKVVSYLMWSPWKSRIIEDVLTRQLKNTWVNYPWEQQRQRVGPPFTSQQLWNSPRSMILMIAVFTFILISHIKWHNHRPSVGFSARKVIRTGSELNPNGCSGYKRYCGTVCVCVYVCVCITWCVISHSESCNCRF